MNIRDADATWTLSKAEADLRQMKSAQRISGDSWQLYRYTGTFLQAANKRYYIVFRTPNNLLTTVKLDQELWPYQVYPTGVITNDNSTYYFVIPPTSNPNPAYPFRYGLTSSQRGVLTIEENPPV